MRGASIAVLWAAAFLIATAPGTRPAAQAATHTGSNVTVTVDGRQVHQRIEGFGAAYLSLADDGVDVLGDLRHRALAAVFQEVRLSTGFLDAPVLEAGRDRLPANDDDDPNHFEWRGFQTDRADAIRGMLLDEPEAAGLATPPLGQRINVRWGSPWLLHLRHENVSRYLDEAAEQVAAGLTYWRDTLGITPKFVLLFNEPTTGNRELDGGTTAETVALVAHVGQRLLREGFSHTKFIVPNEESEQASLDSAKAILSDREARPFVGAIGYHPYPWGSAYVSIPRILGAADHGRVSDEGRAVRRDLQALGHRYGVPLWMTEVSHGDVDARSFDDLRGRAIHIHDELEYADASAYFGMQAIWDMKTHQKHFADGRNFWNEEGSVVLVDQTTNTVQITGMGYAIGHYARWLRPGAVRIDAASRDPLVLTSAFRDDDSHRLVVVIINNAGEPRHVHLEIKALRVSGGVVGEQSTAAAAWVPVTAGPVAEDAFSVDVPPRSVTTLAAAIEAGGGPSADR